MKRIGRVLVIVLCSALISACFNWLLIPHQLLSGGFSGVSMIIGYITGWNIGLLFLIMNIPILIWGWFIIGRTFIVYSILSVVLTFWFMQLIPVWSVVENPLLAAVFGGVLAGASTGFSLRIGGSTGGFDIVGSIISRTRDFPLGMFLFAVNSLIIAALGYYKNDWDLALTSMLSIYLAGRVVDAIHIRHVKLTAFIITQYKDEMMQSLLALRRGATAVQVEGAYSHHERTMLMTVITRYELAELKRSIRECDPNAFVNIVETVTVIGQFRR
jgi:uncharacterized membrane-anchored protein YitT (DUF2179 family)